MISRAAYEDELIEQAVVPFLAHIDQDQDVAVRNAATGLLIELCLNCDSKRCLELLDILEKVDSRKIMYLFLKIIFACEIFVFFLCHYFFILVM